MLSSQSRESEILERSESDILPRNPQPWFEHIFFGSKSTVLKKVLATLLGLFSASQ